MSGATRRAVRSIRLWPFFDKSAAEVAFLNSYKGRNASWHERKTSADGVPVGASLFFL